MFDSGRKKRQDRIRLLGRLIAQALASGLQGIRLRHALHRGTRLGSSRSDLEVAVDGRTYTLAAVAEKRGMVAYVCRVRSRQWHARLRRLAARSSTQVAKPRHEHLIDLHRCRQDHPGLAMGQTRTRQAHRLPRAHLFTRPARRRLDPEAPRPSPSAGGRGSAYPRRCDQRASAPAFDVEKVTKRFYDRFKNEHACLPQVPQGHPRRGHAAVVRLRHAQPADVHLLHPEEGLSCDGDRDYLRNKLAESKLRGKDRYYRDFLCPLFFEGFAKRRKRALGRR